MTPMRIKFHSDHVYMGRITDRIVPGVEERPGKPQLMVAEISGSVFRSHGECFDYWGGLEEMKLKPKSLWEGGMQREVAHTVYVISEDGGKDLFVLFYIMNNLDHLMLLGKLHDECAIYNAVHSAFNAYLISAANSGDNK